MLEYVLWKVLNTNYYEFTIPDVSEQLLGQIKESNDPISSSWMRRLIGLLGHLFQRVICICSTKAGLRRMFHLERLCLAIHLLRMQDS